MTTEKTFWQILSIIVVLITAAVPSYVAYDIYSKGPTPIKRIELHKMPYINPMWDLAALGKEVALSLSIRNQSANNFIIAKEWIRNAGNAPILPTDYYENISINVQKPWKILAVENALDSTRAITFKWKKINDTKFEAEPALLNPDDIVSTNIYLTYTDTNKSSTTGRSLAVKTEWKARIVNMNDFITIPFYSIQPNIPGTIGKFSNISIYLDGWTLIYVFTVAIVIFALYIHMMNLAGILQKIHSKSIILIVGAGLLSFAAAESSSSYLVPNMFIKMSGVQHIENAPWIILHVFFLCYLFWKSRSRTS